MTNCNSNDVLSTDNVTTPGIADTGCSHLFVPANSGCPTTQLQQPFPVTLPNGHGLNTTHETKLPSPNLPDKPKTLVCYLTHAKPSSPLGPSAMQDARPHLANTMCTSNKKNKTLLTGTCNLHTRLWNLPLTRQLVPKQGPSATANTVVQASDISDLIQCLHAACFSPSPSTWIKAVNNNFFTTWPGLTAQHIQKHLPKSPATTKGHLDQTRQGIQSTKTHQQKTAIQPTHWTKLKPPTVSLLLLLPATRKREPSIWTSLAVSQNKAARACNASLLSTTARATRF